jgi:hypothetical protein
MLVVGKFKRAAEFRAQCVEVGGGVSLPENLLMDGSHECRSDMAV